MTRRWLAAGLVLCGWLCAQEPPALLVNEGAPLRVPFACPPDDMEALGLACPAEAPCEAFLELAAVESAGARIFLIGNIHTASVTLYSVLLASSDGGKTWSEPYARIRNGSLDQIQMLDYLNGWIAGQLVQPLPHDPFLLKTTDGGTTWRSYPLFGESRPGVIEWFHFESPKTGVLWVDRMAGAQAEARYERYESVTGGESWILREATARLPILSSAPPGEPVWRLRAEAKANAYRLEKNSENRWQVVASFLIAVGHCQAAVKGLPEPPPQEMPPGASKPPGKPAGGKKR